VSPAEEITVAVVDDVRDVHSPLFHRSGVVASAERRKARATHPTSVKGLEPATPLRRSSRGPTLPNRMGERLSRADYTDLVRRSVPA